MIKLRTFLAMVLLIFGVALLGVEAKAATGQGAGVYWNGSTSCATATLSSNWDCSVTALSYLCDGSIWTGNGEFRNVAYAGIVGDTHRWTGELHCEHTNLTWVKRGDYTTSLDAGGECVAPAVFDSDLGDCITPATCDDSITGTAFLRPVFSGGNTGDICHESSQCKMSAGSVTGLAAGDLVEYIGTNESCGAEPVEQVGAEAEQAACITSGGDTWCTEPDLADQNCGYYNEDYLCLGDIPDGGCTFFGNGDMACSSNATSPPAPDDGITPGNVATPDGTINNNGAITNIFEGATVGASSGATSGSQQTGAGYAGQTEAQEIDFSQIIEQEPDSGSFDDDATQVINDTSGELDDLIAEFTDPEDFGESTTLGADISGALDSLSCTDMYIEAGQFTATISCADAAPLRNAFGWAMRIFFLLAMFHMITTRPR